MGGSLLSFQKSYSDEMKEIIKEGQMDTKTLLQAAMVTSDTSARSVAMAVTIR